MRPLHALGRWGKTRYGCLVTILVFVATLYYGVDVGAVYLRYWQMLAEMRAVARFATRLDDATIQRRLHGKAEELSLPTEAHRFIVRRLARPREIRISTSYSETVTLPFTVYTIPLNPVARAPL